MLRWSHLREISSRTDKGTVRVGPAAEDCLWVLSWKHYRGVHLQQELLGAAFYP